MLEKYLPVLAQIVPSYFRSVVGYHQGKKARVELPEKIDEYTFLADLSFANSYPFAVGLYKDHGGNKVVVKIWEGRSKDLNYFTLSHQIKATKVLARVQKRLLKKKDILPVRFPEFLDGFERNGRLVLIIKYASGRSLTAIKGATRQYKIYRQCLDFLEQLSVECKPSEISEITVKGIWDLVFLYPLILSAAILKQSKRRGLIASGAPTFLSGIKDLLRLNPDRLIHGDLQPQNILVSANSKFILDVAQTKFGFPEYEAITTISSRRHSGQFKRLVIAGLLAEATKKGVSTRALATLVINNSTHNFTSDVPEASLASYEQVFRWGLSLAKEK